MTLEMLVSVAVTVDADGRGSEQTAGRSSGPTVARGCVPHGYCRFTNRYYVATLRIPREPAVWFRNRNGRLRMPS